MITSDSVESAFVCLALTETPCFQKNGAPYHYYYNLHPQFISDRAPPSFSLFSIKMSDALIIVECAVLFNSTNSLSFTK